MTSENIHLSPTMLLDIENGVTRRKFGDITFELRHPIYNQSDGRHYNFCERGLNYCYILGNQKECACASLPIGESRMNKF